MDYEPTGKMKRMVQGNGTITLYGYDAKSTRLLSIITTAKSGEVLQKKAYQYTRSGNMKQIRDDGRKVTYDYTYDGLHRLTAEKETNAGGQASTDTYAYDEIGNIKTRTVDGVAFSYGYDTARPHAVRSVTVNGKAHYFTYDPNGNLTYGPDLTDPFALGWRTLTWTGDNMPKEVKYKDKTAPVTIRFEYDGEGRRVKKTVSVLKLTKGTKISIDPKITSTTLYVDDSHQVVNGKTVKYLFAGTMRIAEIRDGALHYYHKDHLGSSSVLTDVNGNRIESAEYLPFGQIREYAGTWTTDYKFTDQEMDTESGLYNFNARLYDPTLGRFISPDPAVTDLSDPTNPRTFDPQMLNRYAHCRNNPMIYVLCRSHWAFSNGSNGRECGSISR
jgi:RHS repeat-associated protein